MSSIKNTRTVFKAIQKEFRYRQTNFGSRQEVFSLLCPEREKEWLDGWTSDIIYSRSGFAELHCVFVTPHVKAVRSIWQITEYEPENFRLVMVRMTPGALVVRIEIHLEFIELNVTGTHISYLYTSLNQEQNHFIEQELPDQFTLNMQHWENAINHFLTTGSKLLQPDFSQ